eukprot:CAMPEP_0206533558 /NCGR_PEP_ID=MMETSP0325_2-20121206/5029_1 /ASSEMBLY_ACC=CAM_ASM_000347 /TAXON_ID=2866 /ORGANISM="Crypthecodinium cohnii, Strain Seligo" /LENGTH=516 /DNA_ID=CAMNT_0054030209 /DNA_START=167 /DNA_END=1715 /DNA_ORIENTATION=-
MTSFGDEEEQGTRSQNSIPRACPDTLAQPMPSSNRATRSLWRRLFVVSTPGLEKVLQRELQALRIPGVFETVPGGVTVEGSNESLWRIPLQSRVAESVRLRIGEPFHSPDERTLKKKLATLPWEECVDLTSKDLAAFPTVRAASSRSRLYHTKLLESCVTEALEVARSKTVPDQSDPVAAVEEDECQTPAVSSTAPVHPPGEEQKRKRDSETRRYLVPPDIRLQMKYDECQVSAAATGLLHRRGYRKAVGDAPLRETLAAACVQSTPLLRRLAMAEHSEEELLLWDPFCGTGTLLLEAMGIALGTLPGISAAHSYPFLDFPTNSQEEYEELLRELTPEPAPGLGKFRLLGSDVSETQLEHAQKNLRRFGRRLAQRPPWPTPEAAHQQQSEGEVAGLPIPIDLQLGSPAKIAQTLAGRPTMIITNVPYGIMSGSSNRGGKRSRQREEAPSKEGAAEAYAQLGRILRQQKADWRGVFCLAADPDDLRQHTALEWTSELRFLNGTRWVELLQWTGQTKP